jgi:glycosyltransferase involved in cell wall biosynthesis
MVCEGDASTSETVFSGTAKRMYLSLVQQGDQVFPVDAAMGTFDRAKAAIFSFGMDRGRWRSKFRYGTASANLRTSAAKASLKDLPLDALLQIGATFDPPGKLPYAIYSDWNMALDVVEAKAGAGTSRGLTVAELDAIGRDHTRRYQGAAIIFTISERLRQSFIDLYHIAPDKVITAYAGPNFDMELIDRALSEPKPHGAPTFLFIAKEFRRKGGDLVAKAFAQVQQSIPEARLIFAGAEQLPKEFEDQKNIDFLGLLDKTNPTDLQKLLAAYRRSDILVLPSRHDPFPTVIREAMFFGLPCIASDIWAMSEMIENEKTGFLVPSDDAEALARRMQTLAENDDLRIRMGDASKQRAKEMFSWEAVGKVLHSGMTRVVGQRAV